LAIGGYCMVGASNAFNQVIEKDLDALMDRTKNRPVPSGRMSSRWALIIATVLTVIGIVILYTINPKSAMFGAISISYIQCLYAAQNRHTIICICGCFSGSNSVHVGLGGGNREFWY
jgi:protoheme IX farnesyltransferase